MAEPLAVSRPPRTAPSHLHVIRSITRRELGIAARRWLVRLLFFFSLVPPVVFGIILVVRVMAKQAVGMDLGWDPVLRFLMVQAQPVTLLALGLGTPLVARDRSEDVLYLYATRPVLPWHYTAGKMLAVALPSFLLLVVPGILIAVLRQGVLGAEVTAGQSLLLVAKVVLAALFIAVGFAGVSVGPSAVTKRARWALLIAAVFFIVPDSIMTAVRGSDALALGPAAAGRDFLRALFGDLAASRAWLGALVLTVYGLLGVTATQRAVRREMIP